MDDAQFNACMARMNQLLSELEVFPPDVLLSALMSQAGNGLRIFRERGLITAEQARDALAKIERTAFPP